MFGFRPPPEPEEFDPDQLPPDALHKTRIPVHLQAGTETAEKLDAADSPDGEFDEPLPFHIIHGSTPKIASSEDAGGSSLIVTTSNAAAPLI